MLLRRLLPVVLAGAAIILPPAAQAQDQRPRFVIIAFGDSYASGEGDPEVAGSYAIDGRPGTAEIWTRTSDATAFDAAWRCHRSPKAGAARAAATLQAKYPAINIVFASFACSGAQADSGLLGVYTGSDDHFVTSPPVASQISQAETFLATQPDRHVDAIVMNIGGNDAHFADIIRDCLFIPDVPLPQLSASAPLVLKGCESNPYTRANFTTGLASLAGPNGLYGQINSAFNTRLAPGRVYLTEVPNPTRGSDGQFCHLSGPSPYNKATRDEARFIETTVMNGLNTQFRTSAAQMQPRPWVVVSGIADDYRTHGICSATSWFRSADEAMRIQGPEVFTFHLTAPDGSQVSVGALSSGFLHPNSAGYVAIGNRIAAQLDQQIQAQFTVAVAPRLTVDSLVPPAEAAGARTAPVRSIGLRAGAGSGSIRFAWNNPAPDATTGFVLAVDGQERRLGRELTSFTLRHDGRVEARIRACGALSCGPWSATIVASNILPGVPTALRKVATPGTAQWAGVLPLAWTPADGEQEYFEVQYQPARTAIPAAGTAGLTVRRPATTAINLPGSGGTRRTSQPTLTLGSPEQPLGNAALDVRVRACTNAGCSAFTASVTVTAGATATAGGR
jgi:hypothetical protein